MLVTIGKLLAFLTHSEKVKSVYLVLFAFLIAILDVFGIASIMPFVAILNDPDLLSRNDLFQYLYSSLGVSTPDEFIVYLGVFIFILLIISLASKAALSYYQMQFVRMIEYRMATELMRKYLAQPYEWFLSRNSATLGKAILAEVGVVVHGGLTPFFQVIIYGMSVIVFVCLLLVIDVSVALSAGSIFGIAYGLIYLLFHSRMAVLGEERLEANERRFAIISEAFGALKEVKAGCFEEHYRESFDRAARMQAIIGTHAQAITLVPRYALEALAFGGVLAVMTWLFASNQQSELLPLLAVYALAGYRLMPAIQHVYAGMSQIKFINAGISALTDDLSRDERKFDRRPEVRTLLLKDSLVFSDVTYRYPSADCDSLKSINFRVHAGTSIGIVGLTGGGKTTLVDVMLGLLDPTSGSIFVDGVKISEANKRSWANNIGYVPQRLYLSDATIAANVAFGFSEIDQDRVIDACKKAQLHEFICSKLPKAYDTVVGERGVRLSGGQCQRVGLARAFYRNPKLLILDEATSALDNLTEIEVMEAVNSMSSEDVTVIMVAHRLTTVKKCSRILLLNDGRIEADGTYDELVNGSEVFNQMVSRQAQMPELGLNSESE